MIIRYGIGFFGQIWPYLGEILNSNCAICWDFLGHMCTSNVSLYFLISIAVLVKVTMVCRGNQPVTNGRRYTSHLVGTSETTRATSYFPCANARFKKETLFNQWLAGLIDGDGCFLVSKAGYSSCEITVALADERMLRIVQNKLGGAIKPRSGVQAIRWRLHNRAGMIDLVNRVNGYIRHSKRLVQLSHICTVLDLQILTPDTLNKEHGWFSGFFDADGTIGYSLKGPYSRPQLTLSVTNKIYTDVEPFLKCFGGQIYFDKAQNGYYKWTIQSTENFQSFLDYIKICPPQSIKRNRLFLVKEYYRLVSISAHKAAEGTVLYKAWVKFNRKW